MPLPDVLMTMLSVAVNLATDVSRPAVKSATLTFLVVPDCTIGSTSVPAKGVVAAVSAEIFLSAISML
ncbi:MAG: hypothetical protein EB117_14935, partial [Betaproteobacteria bacterium]|nr:hypothetical protein [Betaproteobacteria bacterium]